MSTTMKTSSMYRRIRHLVGSSIRAFIHRRPLNKNLSPEEYISKISDVYEKKLGLPLNIDSPTTFNEKINWLRAFFDHPDISRIVDKVTFKEYVFEKLGRKDLCVPLFRVWNAPWEIDFRNLPSSFVVKSNCQSEGKDIILVQNSSTADLSGIKWKAMDWFNPYNRLTNSFERPFHRVRPKVFVEEFLSDLGEGIVELKFFCFNGNPEYIYVTKDHFVDGVCDFSTYPIVFYDMNWNKQEVRYGTHTNDASFSKPREFSEMAEIARILSAEFPFVRVDFFVTAKKFYLAEMTFYPSGGRATFVPESFNALLGSKLVLPQKIPLVKGWAKKYPST